MKFEKWNDMGWLVDSSISDSVKDHIGACYAALDTRDLAIVTMRGDYDKAQLEIQRLRKEFDAELQRRFEGNRIASQETAEEVTALNQEIDALKAANGDLSDWFDAAREEAKSLQSELAKVKQDAADGDLTIDSLNKIITEMKDCGDCQEVERMRAELASLKSSQTQGGAALRMSYRTLKALEKHFNLEEDGGAYLMNKKQLDAWNASSIIMTLSELERQLSIKTNAEALALPPPPETDTKAVDEAEERGALWALQSGYANPNWVGEKGMTMEDVMEIAAENICKHRKALAPLPPQQSGVKP